MRYYLDTNTLIFFLLNQRSDLNKEVIDLLDDYSNTFYVSSIVARELISLYKDKKVKHSKFKSVNDLFIAIEVANYEIKPFTKRHVITYAELEDVEDHKDPTDHMIIAQSISDKIPIISSDKKFKLYESQGLQLVFNKR
jgi:PIN domain nuclease of toxin-antitoxin system